MVETCDVTAVIPTRNRGRDLLEAVASVFGQRCRPVAIIVVDDGSDDPGALGALDHVEAQGVEVVRRQTQGGPGAARNDGVGRTDTRLVAFLDDDDRWLPAHLSQAIEMLAGLTSATYATPVNVLDRESNGRDTWYLSPGPRLPAPGEPALLSQLPWPELVTSSWVVSAADWRAVGGMNPAAVAEDFGCWWKLVALGVPVMRGDAAQVIYRRHPDNASCTPEHRAHLLSDISRQLAELSRKAGDDVLRNTLRELAGAARQGRYPDRTPLLSSDGPGDV